MVKRLILCCVFLGLLSLEMRGQQSTQEETESFILEVMASYKNPMAYYPLRRDLFLPGQAEIDSLNQLMDSYSSPHVMYKILFVYDDSLKREPFLDAKGQMLFPSRISGSHSSRTNGFQYFRRKQERLIRSSPELGKFLLYNRMFKESGDLEKHGLHSETGAKGQ
ncbi:hypothetical protein [Roseivirga sp.]|uniref:hypothetical protein n=1 Tax=Roseivirga sp. TaxID=1964215 RepID=UPI003B52F8D2